MRQEILEGGDAAALRAVIRTQAGHVTLQVNQASNWWSGGSDGPGGIR